MAPGFQNGREELRTLESVRMDRMSAGPDGDSRPLEVHDPLLEAELDQQRGLKIEERLRQQDRAGVGGGRRRR